MYRPRSLKYKKQIPHQYCINCGKVNHSYSNCMETLNSYGILCFYNDKLEINDKLFNSYKLVMVRRQHTIPYVEFLRGKYHTLDLDYLIILFSRMTQEEITMITNNPNFDELRDDLKLNNKQKKKYKDEYLMAENKFNIIIATGNLHYIIYAINYLFNQSFNISFNSCNASLPSYQEYINDKKDWIDSLKSKICNQHIYQTPEWGVPKGRRQNKESDLKCALREFCEETGLKSNSIKIFKNVIPLEEIYIGLNGIEYKHTYFLAMCMNLPKNYEMINYQLQNQIVDNHTFNININTNDKGATLVNNTSSSVICIDNNINRCVRIPIRETNKEQLLEISEVSIMSLPQIKENIREYHIQKLNIINKAFYIILQMGLFFE